MSSIFPKVDPDGLLEYSVVYTDRAVNHMSQSLQQVMRDISSTLKKVYNAHSVAIVPGSGTFGMEAVARQFATDKKCLVIRNGWFSYRWTQIFEMGRIPSKEIVLMAQQTDASATAPFAPPTIEAVLATIEKEKPDVVFAPHVETSSGMILPNDYIQKVGEAIHAVGGLFILDCIASGAIWVDMEKSVVDVLISAPQKGWSGSPCAALVMMSEAAQEKLEDTVSTSFACDLVKWLWIMKAYEKMYEAIQPLLNSGSPEDAIALLSYLNREQYGDWPVFYGQYYTAPIESYDDGSPQYIKDRKAGKYKITDKRIGTIPVYDKRFTTIFPRMWSNRKPEHKRMYNQYARNARSIQVDGEIYKKPSFGDNLGFFFDYHVPRRQRLPYWSLCGYWPLWAGIASQDQAERMVKNLDRFAQPHGLAQTDIAYPSPHPEFEWVQWSHPAGWPTMQIIVVESLIKYGFEEKAQEIAQTYLTLILNLYQQTGELWEKYNVVKGNLEFPVERYTVPPMHGWTSATVVLFGKQIFNI